ncbi:MAG: hypothetical protein ACREJB_01455, partial [Planctomycetaceae bacterium]
LDDVDPQRVQNRDLTALLPAVRTMLEALAGLDLLPSQEARLFPKSRAFQEGNFDTGKKPGFAEKAGLQKPLDAKEPT